MNITERISQMCEFKGISINKLEQETGIGRGNVARWTDHSPSLDKIQRVAEYFGITVSELLGENEQKESAIVSDDALDEELIELLTRLTPAQEEKVVSYIKFLLSNPEA